MPLSSVQEETRQTANPSTQRPARKHHFLPVFYTKWWAGSDGRVERFTKHGEVIADLRVPPSRVGWQNDLYRIPGTSADNEQALEELFFKQLDNRSAIALRKMNLAAACSPRFGLTAEETSAWATFMMSLLHRSPEYLEDVKRAGHRLWMSPLEPDLAEKYAAIKSPEDPATYEEYVANRDPLESEITTLWGLPQLIANPKLGQVLVNLDWFWYHVPDNCPKLLLSDNPLARSNGLMKQDGHLAMPLSPRKLLVIAGDPAIRRRFDATPTKELIKAMNKWTVQSARRFVVASDLSQASFIRKHFGVDPKPSISSTISAASA